MRNVPFMETRGPLSVVSMKRYDVVAIPFRDKRFAMLFMLGGGVTPATVKQYLSSGAFLAHTGFRSVMATLKVPRFALSTRIVSCIGSCNRVHIQDDAGLSFAETGAGDARLVPRGIPKLMNPFSALTYSMPQDLSALENVQLIANRPFGFAIVDTETQSVLLLGMVERPIGRAASGLDRMGRREFERQVGSADSVNGSHATPRPDNRRQRRSWPRCRYSIAAGVRTLGTPHGRSKHATRLATRNWQRRRPRARSHDSRRRRTQRRAREQDVDDRRLKRCGDVFAFRVASGFGF